MSLIAKLRDRANDYLLGISAAGIVPMDQPGHVYYAAMPHRHVRAVLDLLDLTIDDVFCDIGCGKGRVLALTALHHPPRRLIGIEYDTALIAIARLNLEQWRKIRLWHTGAEDFDYADVTVAYAFNPFEPALLDACLGQIRRTRGPKPFRMVYLAENDGHREVFDDHLWLTRSRHVHIGPTLVSLYTSVG
jgi:SAM-dependent methyltransferase